MTRSKEQEKKREKPRTKSSPEMKKMAAPSSGLPWTSLVGQVTGHPATFAVVLLYAALWLVFDRQHFDFNAVATLAVWIYIIDTARQSARHPRPACQTR